MLFDWACFVLNYMPITRGDKDREFFDLLDARLNVTVR